MILGCNILNRMFDLVHFCVTRSGVSGLFDTDPELTNGCTNLNDCIATTPFEFSAGFVNTVRSFNSSNEGADSTSGAAFGHAQDLGSQSNAVFALWTPVP